MNIRVQAPADASGVAGHARIVVEDDGSGIPDAIRERVFDLFFTTRSDGTGIGLAIVKRIASEHGATINVVSAPGEGTRIELLWPLATAIGSTTASTA